MTIRVHRQKRRTIVTHYSLDLTRQCLPAFAAVLAGVDFVLRVAEGTELTIVAVVSGPTSTEEQSGEDTHSESGLV